MFSFNKLDEGKLFAILFDIEMLQEGMKELEGAQLQEGVLQGEQKSARDLKEEQQKLETQLARKRATQAILGTEWAKRADNLRGSANDAGDGQGYLRVRFAHAGAPGTPAAAPGAPAAAPGAPAAAPPTGP